MHYTGIILRLWYNHPFFYRVKLWAGKFGWLCTMKEAGFFYYKYLCQDDVLPTDFTVPEQSDSSLMTEMRP